MTGRIFQQWLTDHLIPELPPGSVVICDNLLRPQGRWRPPVPGRYRHGAALYFPPANRDLNSIEQVFAKALPSEAEGLKFLLRRAVPRSVDAVVAALKHILERFRPAGCANYLKYSGYVQNDRV